MTATVSVQDTEVGRFSVKPDTRQAFEMTVPRNVLSAGLNELTVVTPTWRPTDVLGTSDQRELGIMLDSVILNYSGKQKTPQAEDREP